ncbi:DEAD/DEAH box helicase [Sediminibacillus halophilus]|uniref:Superfamily II DNA or RNA helicase, SNF2 family n=1 Tax=Sediminibacillus halophilus TaxID=482461 RepID=A0A1G9ND81_9BACI|nr:DEAD/DEAH box helicase [Sediminibacillus halophilus]SDL84374.1 Superfamily II DNA or RNA helicase, SNF2 family [Sediminibacillus halophilus]
MKLNLTQKKIKDRCGTVSFRSGETFFRSRKVELTASQPGRWEAIVIGKEDFHVLIEMDKNGDIRTSCSCPSLAGFPKDCQHIAAALLAIEQNEADAQASTQGGSELTDNLVTLFKQPEVRPASQQSHFENRQLLDVQFTCKLVSLPGAENYFVIGLAVSNYKVKNIPSFLRQLQDGKPVLLSPALTIDMQMHCLTQEEDAVLKHLTDVIQDQREDMDNTENEFLPIPPSAWEKLRYLLQTVKHVELEYLRQKYPYFEASEEKLPLRFELVESEGKQGFLHVEGLENIVLVEPYQTVLAEGKLIKVERHDCKRLAELMRMLGQSGTKKIPIERGQFSFFIEKVVPGLKNIGMVTISGGEHLSLANKPLIAKLYLDRVNSRLLAGLEFHYDQIVINPLEGRELALHSLIVRDSEKEEAILQLMEGSLFTKTDSGYYLHNEELEYDFLTYTLPELQKLARVYTTTAVRVRVVKENIFPRIRVKVHKDRMNWLEYKFELDGIADDQVKELLQDLEEKRKYHRLRNGSLLSLETKEFQEIRRFLNDVPDGEGNIENGLKIPFEQSLQLLDQVDSNPVLLVEDSFRAFLRSISRPNEHAFDLPPGLERVLREYQIRGFQWLKTLAFYGFGGILADDMGLGKTVQAITYLLSEQERIRKHQQPALIVCPSSVTHNWLHELKKFAPDMNAMVIEGEKQTRKKIIEQACQQDILIVSYPILRRDIAELEKAAVFHTVFYDEAQAFKNPVTQTARAAKRVQSTHRFALTGTPVENTSEELWSIFHVVFPSLFQGLRTYSFLSKEAVAKRAKPFILRRMKTDVLAELPKKRQSIDMLELLPEQKKLYAAYLAKLRHDTLKHLDKETLHKNKIRILAGLTRLRQICCHPGLFVDNYQGSSAKFRQLFELIREAKLAGRRLLVFSQFTKMLDLIGRELTARGWTFFYLDGQTPGHERVETCERFNEGERDLFLISMKAGGTGLNLTGADTVILYDSWWNPAVEEQAADRAYRIGQQRDVEVIKLVARGTIEEKMNDLQEKKRKMIGEILDSDAKQEALLTETDIKELLAFNEY